MDNFIFECSECGHELELMHYYHEKDYVIGLFNCNKCGSAWKIKETEKGLEKPERYFFG